MKILVSNIPIHAYETGLVTVPDDTPEEKLQDAIRDALLQDGYESITGFPTDAELDTGIIGGGWEFLVPSASPPKGRL